MWRDEEYENFVLENLEFGRILAGDGNQRFFRLFNRLGVHIDIWRQRENSVYVVDMIADSQDMLDWARAVILDAQERFTTGTWGTTSEDAIHPTQMPATHHPDSILMQQRSTQSHNKHPSN